MENLEKIDQKPNNPNLLFEARLGPKEEDALRKDIKRIKEKYEKLRKSLESKTEDFVEEEIEGGTEVLGVEEDSLSKKDLCAFKLYKDMRDNKDSSVQDWIVFMKALEFYRKELKGKEKNIGEEKFFSDSVELTMKNEFLAWLYNLSLIQFAKRKNMKHSGSIC